ncbi:MAG: hypothetical protein NC338_08405 [Firmicutes bacterium]|nr:hypothetical protein [Bacillota bacterium]MCM1402026.1 hypothetical protein [Bacteroides sp.]MCM1477955.1 hypothetical protein [Bacteroides sp.]
MAHRFLTVIFSAALCLVAMAADPTDTNFSRTECLGSYRPYPAPEHLAAIPDSLQPVMINHVGRHGARFPSSPRSANTLLGALRHAESTKTITPLGKRLLKITQFLMETVNGRWGALDSLGMAEQRGIASRMIAAYPDLFKNSLVNAISSYSPRCIMSMDEFTHQLARMNNSVELDIASGRRFSPLVRFFDANADYTEFRKSEALHDAYHGYIRQHCPTEQLKAVLGNDFDFDSYQVPVTDLATAEFAVLTGFPAMGINLDTTPFLTNAQTNALWAINNLKHYLQHSSSTLSSVPSAIASPLLEDLIATTDAFIAGNGSVAKVNLRFGHAETLMPLLALMHIKGCYYLTNYFDTVGLHWQDFNIVPMAANLQLILLKSTSGTYYVRTELNEVPVPLLPDNPDLLIVPWVQAREYLQRCIPLF